jgi:hypothetical protein
MNYEKHYSLLIERAKTRTIEEYTEKHHIVPKCVGGNDEKENLVALTPEEHFLAHQLLVKIYPNESKLIYAALMMCSSSKFHGRRNNKLYGWIKRSYQSICKQRIGDKNGSYGTRWITDGVKPMKIKNNDPLPDGYVEGRSIKVYTNCCICGSETGSTKAQYCNNHRGRRANTDPTEVLAMYESGVPLQEILTKYGWKKEQNVTTYLRNNFPNRKKFLPNERTISR